MIKDSELLNFSLLIMRKQLGHHQAEEEKR